MSQYPLRHGHSVIDQVPAEIVGGIRSFWSITSHDPDIFRNQAFREFLEQASEYLVTALQQKLVDFLVRVPAKNGPLLRPHPLKEPS